MQLVVPETGTDVATDVTTIKGRGFIRVPWSAGEAVAVFAAAWIGLPLLAVIILNQLGPVIPAVANFNRQLAAGDLGASFAFDLADAAASLGLVFWRLRQHSVGLAAVGWRKFNWLKATGYLLAIYIIFLIGVAAIYALVSALVPGFNADQAQSNAFTDTIRTAPSLSFVALVLIPPVMEETVFRGYLFPALSQRFGTVIGAVVTSVLFGFAHLQWNVSLYTFVLSLLLCFLYVRLRSIWPGVAFHMINNFLAFIAIGAAK